MRDYNPDLLMVEHAQDTPTGRVRNCWLVEVKSDKEDEAAGVKAKHAAAARWAARANAQRTGDRWNVLRVNETDVNNAKGSWKALKQARPQGVLTPRQPSPTRQPRHRGSADPDGRAMEP